MKKSQCVYVIEREHSYCKIGISCNFERRKKALELQGGFIARRAYATEKLENARRVECAVHTQFAAFRETGEWFSVLFETAVDAIERETRIIGEMQADECQTLKLPLEKTASDAATGSLLRCLRKKRGLSQSELAAALNLSQQAVSKWERGVAKPDMRLFRVLSDFYGVHLYTLMGLETTANGAAWQREEAEFFSSGANEMKTKAALNRYLMCILWPQLAYEQQRDLLEIAKCMIDKSLVADTLDEALSYFGKLPNVPTLSPMH